MTKDNKKWNFWIDRGGTFTDIIAKDPRGNIFTRKILSENRQFYDDPVIEGIRRILNVKGSDTIPANLIEELRIGTTVATNALLTRSGAKTALFITKGYKDALTIGNQTRSNIFARKIISPRTIYDEVYEIDERISSNGKIITDLNMETAKISLKNALQNGCKSAAIVLLHGWKYRKHEKLLENLAKSLRFKNVSVSHKTSPLIGLIGRGDTTVADAYLTPVIQKYARNISKILKDTKILFMQSSGGLAISKNFKGKDAILSGPAGGVIASVEINKKFKQFDGLIGVDMGGTSTDVFHYEKEYERSTENIIAGTRIKSPMLVVNTIAAGGGSIIKFDGQKITVGPDSAGANPGPACYGLNGPFTITDCNFILGRLDASFFPKIFGSDANQHLNLKASKLAAKKICLNIEKETGKKIDPFMLARGALDIAVENMANAIRHISIQKGHDIFNHSLVAYGAAAGQVACDIADSLSIKSIIFNSHSGLLSAYGLGYATLKSIKHETIGIEINKEFENLNYKYNSLEKLAKAELYSNPSKKNKVFKIIKRIFLRYEETEVCIPLEHKNVNRCIKEFKQIHKKRFGFIHNNKKIFIDRIEVELETKSERDKDKNDEDHSRRTLPKNEGKKLMFFKNSETSAKYYLMKNLRKNNYITGPAMIYDDHSTIMVSPNWKANVIEKDTIFLIKKTKKEQRQYIGKNVDPIKLEIFNNIFMSVAEEMGVVLQNTSHSVNIKERLDFSCALFNKNGSLIANAPHIPIHLGAMSESIKAVIKKNKKNIFPGDSFIHNSPYNGGTHLPDITIITPIFLKNTGSPSFYVASRAHHADIGGVSPGSMPAYSSHIDQEGTVFNGEKIVSNYLFLEKKIMKMFLKGPYPARNVKSNIADLKAQLAAAESGKNNILRIIKKYGIKTVSAYMKHVQNNAEESIRKVISKLKNGCFKTSMDNNASIKVQIIVDKNKRNITFDFSGTSAQRIDNFNAPKAVTRSAILYVLRTLVKENIPLNDGCLIPVSIILPKNLMLNPAYPAPVVAGNVETSQTIVDALNGALKVQAACYGTMSNFTFGNDNFGYYETICGGEGASYGHNGTSAIHCHMTNTRLTDPEILESRYPVRLIKFLIRKNSGGKGRYKGGNGTIREIEFRKNITATILSNRREIAPFGILGGEPGLTGQNILKRVNKKNVILKSCDTININKGDRIIIKTPGGGGFGKKQ